MRWFAAAALGCALAASLHAQDAARGASLLAEARAAIGGDARLAAIRSLDVQGDFRRAVGQTGIEGELQIRIERPDKLRRDEDLSPPGGGPAIVRTEVLNGAAVWDENAGPARMFGRGGRGDGGGGRAGGGRAAIDPATLEEAQRRARQTELARWLLVWLLDTGGTVTWVGTAEAPDGKAEVLEITPGSGPAVRLFLDQGSHLPLMITWQGVAPQLVARGRGARGTGAGGGTGRGDGQGDGRGDGRGATVSPDAGPPPPAIQQITLGDYRAVDGVRLPHRITRGINDMTVEEWTIDRYRLNPRFAAGVFTR